MQFHDAIKGMTPQPSAGEVFEMAARAQYNEGDLAKAITLSRRQSNCTAKKACPKKRKPAAKWSRSRLK